MRSIKANGSSQQPEREAHKRRVAKIEKGRCEFSDLELRNKVKYSVSENVNGRPTGHDETSPPPIIILLR